MYPHSYSKRPVLAALLMGMVITISGMSTADDATTAVAKPWQSNDTCHKGILECMVSIETPGAPQISPKTNAVAFTIRKADWENNRYDSEIYLAENGNIQQLSDNEDGSSGDVSWSPDGSKIAYRAVTKNGAQLFIMNSDGTGSEQVTDLPGGVSSYIWSPDGGKMALKLAERPSDAAAAVEERFGAFSFADDYSDFSHLWLLDLESVRREGLTLTSRTQTTSSSPHLKRLTGGKEFTIGSFFGGSFTFTPDGREVLFDHAASNSPYDLGTQDISAVDISTGRIRPIVRRPGIDSGPHVSPDGKTVAFHMGEPPYYYTRQYWIGLTSIDGLRGIEQITEGVPNEASIYGWRENGLFFLSHLGVESSIYHRDTATGTVTNLTKGRGRVQGGSVSADGKRVSFKAADGKRHSEIYTRTLVGQEQRHTNFSDAVSNWPETEVQLIQWKTPDGLDLEGVLTLPPIENRLKGPMPVLVVLHGGPSSTSRPKRVPTGIYPTEYWLRKGAAIFEPNYRGSGSYTDELMAANVGSLGIGYTIDVVSGLDHLVDIGIADPDRLGAMGWSAGGSVTAALATKTKRFKAFSVGAGISDYETYYAMSDQPTSPLAYLEATPWDAPDLYLKASARGSIKNAVTPTLIQHGRDDGRVPFANGMKLFRGLKDAGVETQLVIFENTGHVISRPKERLAAMTQNVRWFDTHLFGDRSSPDLDLTAK